ncbi:hypothetical protein ACROYT_G011720 [Oculina patagonica]
MTEHLDEEEDEDGDEEEEGVSSGLLSCPVDGCICTYQKKENGQRLFQVDEFLTAQQIQGYFSRTAAKLKHATSQSAHVTDDNDLLAAQEEEAFTSARASILDQCQLVHPIVYDTLNMICSLYTSNKLTKLSVAQLRSICDFYNMDIEAQSSKRKAPYISFISDIVGSCSCTRV